MGTFGITDFDSSNALCKDGTIDKNNPSNPCINNGGVDWSGGKKQLNWEGWAKSYLGSVSSTPVVCKDGTKKMQPSSPNAKYSDVCINNGGVDNQKVFDDAKKQYEDALKNEQAKAQAQANSQGNNTKEPIYYILVTAGVLVAGYFAYKKFKK